MKNPIAICQWVLPDKKNKAFHQAAQLGLDGMVIDFDTSEEASLLIQDNRERILEESQETGIYIPTLAVNAFVHKALTKKENHNELKEIAHQAIEIAKSMKIPKIQVPSFYESLVHTEDDVYQTSEFLKYCTKLGEKENLIIGSENVMTVEQNLLMIETIDSPHFKLLFDTQNPWRMMSQDGPMIAKLLKDHVCEVHAKDSGYNYKTKEKTFELLGEGDVNFYGSMKVFCDMKFDAYVVLESPYGLSNKMMGIFAIREDISRIRMM
jgi:sugar phosphate isomerase/epimerase